MRLLNCLFVCLLFLIGCAPKPDPLLRMCMHLDTDYIRNLIPTSGHDFKKYINDIKVDVQNLYDQLISVQPEERTFYNTVRAYDTIYIKLWMGKQIAATLGELHVDSQVRSRAGSAASQLSAFEKKLYSSGLIEQALQEYKDHGSDKKYNKKHVQDYLDVALREHAKFKRVDDGVDYLLNNFLRNSNQSQGFVSTSGDRLAGLSQLYQGSLSVGPQGLYQLPVNYRSFFEVMENGQDEQLRKEFFHAFGKRGYPENLSLMQKIIKKRNQHARDLGQKSFIEHEMDDHMFKDPQEVEKFLWDLVASLQPQEHEMYNEMLEQKPDSVQLTQEKQLQPWNETFLKSHFRKNVLGVDDQKIANYFPLKKTLPKLLHLYEQFFSISFQRDTSYSWWSDDVSLYRVSDERNKELLGYVFFDLLKRDGKTEEQKHIMMVPGIRDDCDLPCLSVSAVVADYHKPKQGDALLQLHEVQSLLHEIGHAVHACFGATKFGQISGTQVARDFVELPSQIFEQWLEDPVILKRISSHCRTGNPLSDTKIDAIVRSQKYVRVSQLLKHSFISLLMLELYKNEDQDPHQVARQVHEKVYPYIEYDPDYYVECSIPHFVSYGPSYYSYVWTKVLAEKLFKNIEKKGILSRSVGREFSKYILAPGGGGDYHSMIKDFLQSIQ